MQKSLLFLALLLTVTLSYPTDELVLSNKELRLIQTSENQEPTWLKEQEIMSLIQQRIRFIDVTDLEIDSSLIISSFSFPKEVKNQVFVNSLYDNINLDRMKDFLTKFSGFYTRYYKSQTGVESNMWLFNELKKISEFANVTVELFKHDWGQHSIIAKFASKRDGPVTIVGAHQDSVNQWNPWYGRSPGADDDGSGTCGNVEAFRILVESGFQPETPLEFHFYAAEEGGLLGSQKIASDYKKRRVEVAGMFQVDMTGYVPKGSVPIIGVATDNVNLDATNFLYLLAKNFNKIAAKPTKCGYGCSDHASWNQQGYPAVFTFETEFKDSNPNIHTSDDTVEKIDFVHVSEFVKLVLAWAVEITRSV